jgi:hypothetical protein
VGSWKLAGVVDDVVRNPEALQVLGGRADEHVVHEEGMVWARANDSHLDPVLGIPPGETVNAEDRITEIEKVSRSLPVELEQLRLDREVDAPPPDLTLRIDVLDQMLVHRRTAGLLPRVGHEGAVGGDGRILLAPDRRLIQRRRRRVAAHVLNGDAMLAEIQAHVGPAL